MDCNEKRVILCSRILGAHYITANSDTSSLHLSIVQQKHFQIYFPLLSICLSLNSFLETAATIVPKHREQAMITSMFDYRIKHSSDELTIKFIDNRMCKTFLLKLTTRSAYLHQFVQGKTLQQVSQPTWTSCDPFLLLSSTVNFAQVIYLAFYHYTFCKK